MKYLHAFFTSLQMTFRGESVAPHPYPELEQWNQQTKHLLENVVKAGQKQGIDREALKVNVDGRNMSMRVILASVHHNQAQEYPRLMRYDDEYSMTTIRALNVDDSYRVSQLLDSDEIQGTTLQTSVEQLLAHLNAIP